MVTNRRIVLIAALLLIHSIASLAQTLTGPSVATTDATAVSASSGELHGIVNPMGRATSAWFEWGLSSTSLTNETDHRNVGDGTVTISFGQNILNLQPHTTYFFRAAARSGDGAIVRSEGTRSFTTLSEATTPPPTTATVMTTEANGITASAAELHGTFNAGGRAMTIFFEWGTSNQLGSVTESRIIDGQTAVTSGRMISGLQPHTTYYFRAVGRIGDLNTRGEIRNFTTLSLPASGIEPSISTGETSGISATNAELHSKVTPAGLATTTWFEWGTSSLSNQTEHRNAGDGVTSIVIAQGINSLQASTTYYYQAVAQNSRGTIRGEVRSFTTTRVPSTEPEPIREVETGSVKSGYVIVTPDAASASPTALLTFAIVVNGNTQSQAGIVPAPMTTDASIFVEVIPQISRNIGVAITNPGSEVNNVTLTLRDQDGMVVGTPATVSIQPKQQIARFVNELFGTDAIGSGFVGSLRLTSPAPFAALGLRFTGMVFSAIPVTNLGTTSPVPAITLTATATPNTPAPGVIGGAGAIIMGQFALAGGWATHVALVNNTNATISGRIDILDTSGNPMAVKLNGDSKSTFTYSIPAGGTFVLAPRDSNGQSPM